MSRHLAIGIACLALSATATRTASAFHAAWVLRDSGTQCSFTTPEGNWRDQYDDGLFNWAPYRRWVSCPISLSARWGSSRDGLAPKLWAEASTAAVYAYNAAPGEEFYCAVQAQMASGAILYSQTVSTTATGDLRLMPNENSNWSGSLEAVKQQDLNSLEFVCLVPPNGSGVYGYKVRMCIRNNNCSPNAMYGDGSGNTLGAGAVDLVQTSGIACVAYNDDKLVRSELGATNVGTSHVSVVCPISPPADETNEVPKRLIRSAEVWYKSSPGGTEVPTCQLHARMRHFSDPLNTSTEAVVSSPFTSDGSDKVVTLRNFSVGTAPNGSGMVDMALSVTCDLPPGYTLEGVHAGIEIPEVLGAG